LGLEKIDVADKGGFIVFGEESHIDPVALVQLVQNDGQGYRLQGSHRLAFRADLGDLEQRFKMIENLLEQLAVSDNMAQAG
jgi:transcription-repair coupling factor (superfamily II helicase)